KTVLKEGRFTTTCCQWPLLRKCQQEMAEACIFSDHCPSLPTNTFDRRHYCPSLPLLTSLPLPRVLALCD
ncbi:hypothetical protein LSAT2_030863, partial [Lamellibrachia satsuma]